MHRVGKPQPNKSRPVLVKFATYHIRKKVYSNRSKLKPRSVTVQSNTGTPQRSDDGTSLNASERELQEPLFVFYVSEIHFICRDIDFFPSFSSSNEFTLVILLIHLCFKYSHVSDIPCDLSQDHNDIRFFIFFNI